MACILAAGVGLTAFISGKGLLLGRRYLVVRHLQHVVVRLLTGWWQPLVLAAPLVCAQHLPHRMVLQSICIIN